MTPHSTFALKAGTLAIAIAFVFGAASVASAQTTGTTGAGGATTTGSFDITSTTTTAAPGLPNTGAGGESAANVASLALSTVALGLGAAYLYSRRSKAA